MFQTTCSVYRGNPASGSPVATGVEISISGTFACGAYQTTPLLRPWTYVAEFPLDCDIRDNYPGQAGNWLLGDTDTVVLDDPVNLRLFVILVEWYVNPAGERVKRVYLDRLEPAWPIEEA